MIKFIEFLINIPIHLIDCFLELIGIPITGPDYPPINKKEIKEKK